jgi:hypothetical protein
MYRLITAALILALGTPALAETPSYNYVTLGWQSVTLDDGSFDVDGDGFGVGGSFEVAENWHILGGYSSLGFDFGVDLDTLQLGGGFHTDISDTTNFYADLLWVSAEVSAPGFGSADDDGYGLSIGVRSNVSDRVELNGGLSYVDYGDGGDGTAFSGSAWYKFTEQFALGATVGIEEDVTGFGVGGRFYFGK